MQFAIYHDRLLAVSVAALVLLAQFFNPSFLAETGKVGTLFAVAFITTLAGCRLFQGNRTIVFGCVHGLILLAWTLLLVGAFNAFYPPWALLWVGIAFVYLLLFLLITNFSKDRPEFAEKLIDSCLIFGLLAALMGLYEYVHFHAFGPSPSALLPYILPPDRESRVAGIYGQPNQFALFLTVTLLAYIYRHLHGFAASAYRFAGLHSLRFLPFLAISLVFFLTRSRGGFLSLFLVIALVAWLISSKRYLKGNCSAHREFLLLLLCLFAGFLLSKITVITGFENVPATRSFADTGNNPSGRFVFWTSAILIFLDHPWLGVGMDNYRFLMNGYGPLSHDVLGFVEFEAMKSTFWAHNELLQLLCEGGVVFFGLVVYLLMVFFKKIRQHFVAVRTIEDPRFLYLHLFILPFMLQSQFEWPLRHPAVLLLFVSFSGILATQYPLSSVVLPKPVRAVAVSFLLVALIVTGWAFLQEQKISDFRDAFLSRPLGSTLDDLTVLVNHPYSEYRILHNTMPHYTLAALASSDDSFAQRILPYGEKLVQLEGAGGQWYDLARLYLRLNRVDDAQVAIWRAFELKPTNTVVFEFLHHLNVIKASRATGRPIKEFYPPWVMPPDLEFKRD